MIWGQLANPAHHIQPQLTVSQRAVVACRVTSWVRGVCQLAKTLFTFSKDRFLGLIQSFLPHPEPPE